MSLPLTHKVTTTFLEKIDIMNGHHSVRLPAVAYKEFLHIWSRSARARLLLNPAAALYGSFSVTLFEASEWKRAGTHDQRDETPRRSVSSTSSQKTKRFQWRKQSPLSGGRIGIARPWRVGALVTPRGWAKACQWRPEGAALYLDGSDTNTGEPTARQRPGDLGDFQRKKRDIMIDTLPEVVFELGKKFRLEIRNSLFR